MDKMDSKWRFLQAGIPTPEGGLINPHTPAQARERLLDRLGTPLVLKPIDQGSTLDVVVAADAKQRDQAIDHLLQKYGRCMAERFLPGREFTVAVLADRPLPVVEIVTPGGFFDFQSKYESSDTRYLLDIDLPIRTYKQMQWLGLQAHRVLGCRDFSRVDIRLDAQARPAILEVNTIPGLTSRSLVPMAAAKARIEFPQLCDRLVRMAYQRSPNAPRLYYSAKQQFAAKHERPGASPRST
jgi:D-alanine-D-alanine ligase